MTNAFRHPLATHPAGTILGYRRNGAPIYAIAGGDGTGETGQGAQSGQTAGQQGDQGNTGTGQAPAGTAPKPTPPAGQQPAEGDLSSLPQWAQDAIKAARTEAGKARTTAKENAANEARQELAQTIGKALGIVQDDEPADPAKLTEQVTDLSGQLRAARVELAAYKAAGTEGARADRLLNSRAFVDKLAALDPTAGDFAEQLKKAITDEVATDPDLYRAAPTGPSRSGGEFNGPPAGERKPATLTDAIAARLGG